MPFQVYIIYSPTKDKYYVGFTNDDMNERIRKHNSNHSGFTGKTNDWELKHLEVFATKQEALSREKEIKKWKSRKLIEKLISS